jgi:hypothetical protein
LKLVVVTPIGPGHAVPESGLCRERRDRLGPHARPVHVDPAPPLRRHQGELGRSRARNETVAAHPDADWFLFVDADDLLHPEAFAAFDDALYADKSLVAVFGAVATDTLGVVPENVFPLDWRTLLAEGPRGTLSMGCFVRADVARAVSFNEAMDAAEDFDWYLRLLHNRHWTKVKDPLVVIRRQVPSAGGPRGYVDLDWRAACQAVVDKWKARMAPKGYYSVLKSAWHTDRIATMRAGRQAAPVNLQLILSDLCNHDCWWCAYRASNGLSSADFAGPGKDGKLTHNPNRMIPFEKAEGSHQRRAFARRQEHHVHRRRRADSPSRSSALFRLALDLGFDCSLNTNGHMLSLRLARSAAAICLRALFYRRRHGEEYAARSSHRGERLRQGTRQSHGSRRPKCSASGSVLSDPVTS